MSLNAHGLASLITTAESTSLMWLFLITRKLKKLAIGFGSSPKATPPSPPSFKRAGCHVVCVFVSADLLDLSVPFVQGLLYSEIPVNVVIADKFIKKSEVVRKVRDCFGYARRRGYMTQEEVGQRVELLAVCDLAELAGSVGAWGRGKEGVVLVNASTVGFSVEEINDVFSEVRHNHICTTSIAGM